MPPRTDAALLWRTCRAALGIAGAFMLVACATKPPPVAKHAEVAGIQQDESGRASCRERV